MIDAANFEKGTLWDLSGLQSRVRVDLSITYVEANVTRTITQETYIHFGWREREQRKKRNRNGLNSLLKNSL